MATAVATERIADALAARRDALVDGFLARIPGYRNAGASARPRLEE